ASDLQEQVVGVSRPADDLDPVLLEQLGHPLAQERGIVGDHDSHGISAVMRVPRPPSVLSTQSRPPRASTRSARPRRPAPSGSAPPTPSSAIVTNSLPFSTVVVISALRAPECFTAFAS